MSRSWLSQALLRPSRSAPVRDLGELDSKPAYRTRVEHYSTLVLEHPKTAARLKGVKLA